MNYPAKCNTPGERMEYLYRAQEKLRIFRNRIADWHFRGLTKGEYNSILPQELKAVIPYTRFLPEEPFRRYCRDDFTRKNDNLCLQINIQKKEAKNSTKWNSAIDIHKLPSLEE